MVVSTKAILALLPAFSSPLHPPVHLFFKVQSSPSIAKDLTVHM